MRTTGNNIYRHYGNGRKRSFVCRAAVSDIRPLTGDDKSAGFMGLWFTNNELAGNHAFSDIWVGIVSTSYFGTFTVVGYSNVSGANIIEWYRV